MTGEIAEYAAAELLGLELAPPRTAGYDAIRHTPQGPVRVQIKRRAYAEDAELGQRLGTIKQDAACDTVMLVLLDNQTLEPREILEAPYSAVSERLTLFGSKARARGVLGVSEFCLLCLFTLSGLAKEIAWHVFNSQASAHKLERRSSARLQCSEGEQSVQEGTRPPACLVV